MFDNDNANGSIKSCPYIIGFPTKEADEPKKLKQNELCNEIFLSIWFRWRVEKSNWADDLVRVIKMRG